jgi:adenylosuccinate synthase
VTTLLHGLTPFYDSFRCVFRRRYADVDTGDKNTASTLNSNTAIALTSYDILQSLHLKHCALVVLSRGSSISNNSITQTQSQQQQQQAAETLSLTDTFIAAGAKVL